MRPALCRRDAALRRTTGLAVVVGLVAGAFVVAYRSRSRGTERGHLVSVGASAGLAAAFNGPLSGAAFALEELQRGVRAAARAGPRGPGRAPAHAVPVVAAARSGDGGVHAFARDRRADGRPRRAC
ncbi:chloride channel protein [Cellulomonas sp. C5510]|nr:chloride channel protein [Cellulomonas sp. C5510]